MGWIDFILNLAGLLLWLNWRAVLADPLGKPRPATLIGTLRRAEPGRAARWQLPVALGALLLLRALLYWQIGAAVTWVGRLDLGVTVLSFSSSLSGPALSLLRMALFSVASFGLMLVGFYSWLVLLSILSGPPPVQALVRMQLGRVDRWSWKVKLLLPPVTALLLWVLASWPLAWLHVIPQPPSWGGRLGEGLVLGLGSYLFWKYLIVALLVAHLLNNYIYFGRHPVWNYINATAQSVLRPLRAGLGGLWSALAVSLPGTPSRRTGKANFSPRVRNALAALLNIAGIALVFLLADLAEYLLAVLYGRLSL